MSLLRLSVAKNVPRCLSSTFINPYNLSCTFSSTRNFCHETPATTPKLTHVDAAGRASMVDISGKAHTHRTARAEAMVHVPPVVFTLLRANASKKGDVLTVAQVAGIQAAKSTAALIPLCHPVPVSHAGISFELREPDTLVITATATTNAGTGIEMEALTAASVAALTVYDMCKAASKDMVITGVRLLEKTGGKSGHYEAVET